MKRVLAIVLLLLLPLTALAEDWSDEVTLTTIDRLPDEVLLTCFNGNVFVGDSITGALRNYVARRRQTEPDLLKDVVFYHADSYKLSTASRDGVMKSEPNLRYMGTEMSMAQIIGKKQPPRVMILLGVNDYIGAQIETGMEYVTKIVDLLTKYAPDTEILFFSLTPVTKNFCTTRKRAYQKMWDEYNARLEEHCAELGVVYLDIATPLKDEDGYLARKYSSDNDFHLNSTGNDIWLSRLCDYAQQLYEDGLWAPEGVD